MARRSKRRSFGERRSSTQPKQFNRRNAPSSKETIWLYGLHPIRAALANPNRQNLRLLATRNAAAKLQPEIATCGIPTEIVDARSFSAPIEADSVHQGAALETRPLHGRKLGTICESARPFDRVVLLDQVTDPHNVGAILRSSRAFDAKAVITHARHSPPETGTLAKAASGALETVPYLRIKNLAKGMRELRDSGYFLVGLTTHAEDDISDVFRDCADLPVGIVLGSEGRGLRKLTIATCDSLARIVSSPGSESLNVSNAAAIALYTAFSKG